MPLWLWIVIGLVTGGLVVLLYLLWLVWDSRPPDLAGMKWPWSR